MNIQIKKWGTLILLSIIWCSSYILIKKGLGGLTAIELGSIRIMITTIIVAPFGYSKIKSIPKEKFKWVLFSACVGAFFPAYLFAFAETQISSSVTAVLVSLTPLFTLLISIIIFSAAFIQRQLLGVFVGFIGILILVYNELLISSYNLLFVSFVIVAAFCYAVNANILKYKLPGISAIGLVFMSFAFLFFPALTILILSDFPFSEFIYDPSIIESIAYIVILALFGTAIAKTMYIKLLEISSPVFSVSTTYLMPIVAIFWGLLDGEEFKLVQVLGTGVILIGVYLVTKKKAA